MMVSGNWSTSRIAFRAVLLALALALPIFMIIYLRLLSGDRVWPPEVELVLRDVTTYLGIWIVAGLALLWRIRQVIDEPARRLSRVVSRIADGDLDAQLPDVEGEVLSGLVMTVQRAIGAFARRDSLKTARLVEMRDLVRHLSDAPSEPLLVIGLDRCVQYASPPLMELLNVPAREVLGRPVSAIKPASALVDLVEGVFQTRITHMKSDLKVVVGDTSFSAARCGVVVDSRGIVSRAVILLLKGAK